ncbi:MAG TPA: hypothetical protein VLI05_03740 [Candidatus Saccharimonadia bacterium]|nr:hypothetical protein [Candidatus Saccharimonadia bacterium]
MKKLKFGRRHQAEERAADTKAGATSTAEALPTETVGQRAAHRRRIMPARRLALASLRDLWAHWRIYMPIVAVVALPIDILSMVPNLANDMSFNAYGSIASLFMTVALIYAIGRISAGAAHLKLSTAYYDGSIAIVRFTIVVSLLVILLIPAALGAMLYIIGAYPSQTVYISSGEQILIGAAALIVSMLSWWWLARFIFSIYAVVEDNYRPAAALRYSRQLTLKRFWRVFGRLVSLVVGVAVVMLVSYIPPALLGLVYHNATVVSALFLTLLMLIGLPLLNLYMFKLYRDLSASHAAQ